jgi:hypothetical protein
MNSGGWAVLLISCGTILALNIFCFWKVFTLPREEEEDLHAPLDIDTHDQNGGE